MKRSLVLLLALGLIFGSVATAEAGKKKKKPAPVKVERTVEFEYACPCLGLFQFGTLTGGDPNLGGGGIAIGDEYFMKGEVKDATGLPLNVSLQQDTDGDGFNDPVADFCGSTEEPLPINPGLEARIFIGGPCADGTPTTGAGGTVVFTFSNIP